HGPQDTFNQVRVAITLIRRREPVAQLGDRRQNFAKCTKSVTVARDRHEGGCRVNCVRHPEVKLSVFPLATLHKLRQEPVRRARGVWGNVDATSPAWYRG